MGHKQIRVGQLIAPFGPGSLYTDRRGIPHVVCGLDHWFTRWDITAGPTRCEDISEFQRFEPRLAGLLQVNRFCSPPDFRSVRMGQAAPPNALLFTPALRFPRWYRHSKTGEMRRFNLNTERVDTAPGSGRWLPVRFVAVCANGHLCEFPWKEWIGCTCQGEGALYLTDRGGSELTSIKVECRTCPQGSEGNRGKNLAGTTTRPDVGEQSAFETAGIACPGERPWLGDGAQEQCDQPLVGALINQTNLYFARTVSAILLPDLNQKDDAVMQIRNEIEEDGMTCGLAKTAWSANRRSSAVAVVQDLMSQRGLQFSDDQIKQALESMFSVSTGLVGNVKAPARPESALLEFRRAEFNILRREVNDPQRIPNLRVIRTDVAAVLQPWFERVNLVERLRETRVFYGFDRLEPSTQPLAGMPDSAMRQLFRVPPVQMNDRWLPAVEVFGEGIYIELKEASIASWQKANETWLKGRLSDAFITRLADAYSTLPPLGAPNQTWASKYLAVHTLAHILINQLVFECGYGTASLRERLYVSDDPDAPMAGILIYTSAGDSEGTLGGLVRLGRAERLGLIVNRALCRASWCSADPVCSENLGGQGSKLANLAACHACVLLPETACETVNHGLDRAMIVGLPTDRSVGMMASLIEQNFDVAA